MSGNKKTNCKSIRKVRSGGRNPTPLHAREKGDRVLYNWTTVFWKLLIDKIHHERRSSVPEESSSFSP
ncbi:hypothetical protein E2C01_042656 [Portunus trituberculatus]|uniref:Uncharacterized protein n=1 Tax=Portunus trituberculatus TaxID=210409 RepID=A0A5B7FMC7_PORTR|nr:hypothetical protein [Portunus trituberculatus]